LITKDVAEVLRVVFLDKAQIIIDVLLWSKHTWAINIPSGTYEYHILINFDYYL